MAEELDKKIEREAKEIADAPKIQPGPAVARCHWCGRMTSDPVLVESVNGIERYKGRECCGGRHS